MTRRILVVDDDIRVHELIRWSLRAPRFEVHAFSDPQRALVQIRDIKPDVIICDMMMPTMDGQVFLRLVKQTPALRHIPFLFLTAVRLGSEVQAALSAGADAYLVKPFPLATLVETVNTVLEAAERRPVPNPDAEPEASEAGERRWPERPGNATVDPASATGEARQDVPPPVFAGRFTTLELEVGRVKVVTEAGNRPHLVITTVLSLAGRGLKKIETFWSHPLQLSEDLELVKRQIDLQHDRAVEDARREPLFGPRREAVWRRDATQPDDR